MRYDLIVFDLDGTLLDTIEDVALSFNEALAQNGMPGQRVEDYGDFVGGTLLDVVSRIVPAERRKDEDLIRRVADDYKSIYADSPKPNTIPFPGIPELLEQLALQGVKLAVNTNKAQALAEAAVLLNFPSVAFDIEGYKEGVPGKPNPLGLNRLICDSGVARNRVLYVGDTESDILVSMNAGVDMVLAAWGQGDSDSLSAQYPLRLVHDPSDVLSWVHNVSHGE